MNDQGSEKTTRLSSASAGERLRALLGQSSMVVVAGGGTALEATCAAASGFESFYVSGYAVSAWRGLPDIGLIGLADVARAVSEISMVTALPLIVDADTGYGGPPNVAVTVRQLEAAGAAAIQIEDQTWPKRCGHLAGKSVIAADEMVSKLRAATDSRKDAATMIIARTDALGPLGFEEALARACLYQTAGADAIFLDAPESEDQLAEIIRTVPGPKVLNMSDSGLTPILPLSRIAELGFQIVLYPTTALRQAARQFSRLYTALRTQGPSALALGDPLSMDELNTLVGLPSYEAMD